MNLKLQCKSRRQARQEKTLRARNKEHIGVRVHDLALVFGRCWLLITLLFMVAISNASERGRVPVDVYTMQDLRAPANTNSVTALPDGRVLVSNTGALMSFDGVAWRKYRHPLGIGYLSGLDFDKSDTLYAGWQSEFGWFQTNDFGEYQWHSLLQHVAQSDRSMGDVTNALLDRERGGVWFVSNRRVFFWDIGQEKLTKVVETQSASASLVDGELWLSAPESLLRLSSTQVHDAATLPIVAGSEAFAGRTVRKVLGNPSGKLIVQAQALFWRATSRAEFAAFAQGLNTRFQDERIADVIRLRNGHWAVLLQSSQILVLDETGSLRAEYGAADGIPANPAKAIFEDRFGSLWLAQERTVSVLHLGRGLTRFNESTGLPGADSLERWNGGMFVGQTRALYRMVPGLMMAPARFERVLPQLASAICMATTFDGARLFVAGYGLHEVFSKTSNDPQTELRSKQLVDLRVCNRMEASRFVAGRIWVAHTNGLLRVDMSRTGAAVLTPMSQVQTPVDAVVEIDANQLLLSAHGNPPWRTSATAGVSLPPLDPVLPEGPVKLFPGKSSPWILTQKGLWQFDAVTEQFTRAPSLPPELKAGKIFSVLEDHTGLLWVRGTDLQAVYSPTGVAMRATTGSAFKRETILDGFSTQDRTIYRFLREGNIVWLSRSDDLLRIDLTAQAPLPEVLAPMLSGIEDLRLHSPVTMNNLEKLPNTVRTLRFSFALPSSLRAAENSYRSRLSSIDADWSPWSLRTDREFTALPDGTQQFFVQARDSLGRESAMPPVILRISAPWFRTPLAMACYVLAAIGVFMLAMRIGAHRKQRMLQIRQNELEATVEMRTHELAESVELLSKQAKQLKEVDRLKTNFFINVGHEFRTPLTLVLGPIDDLLRDARERFSARAREQLEMANRNARRVLDLIVELLDVNRFEHGKMQLMQLPCDIDALVRRCVADSAELMQRFGHQIRFERDDMHDAHAESAWFAAIDAVQIERCISNLIGNAAKYMTRGGIIEVRLARTEAHILISISDHGRGIAPEAVPHIFDRFFQTESSDRARGYGIGLALVHQIIEAHQGRIGVESILGLGSRFQIELTALVSELTQHVAEQLPALKSRTEANVALIQELPAERVRVLIVDDHDDMRARVRALLEQAPYTSDAQAAPARPRFEVIEANDGPSAWLACCEALPDLILCDVMMPGFDGVELCRRLRGNPDTATIPLLLLTAKVGSEHAVAGLNAGADDYLAKPFDASELLARVDALLARGHRLRLRMEREAQARSAPMAAATGPQDYASTAKTSATESRADLRWRERLEAQISAHLSDAEWGIEALSAAMHVDRTHLFRKCKELLGVSPSDYLRDARLSRACELLSTDAGNISEIAYAVGFVSLSSFTRAFKARYSVAPSQMQKTQLRKAS